MFRALVLTTLLATSGTSAAADAWSLAAAQGVFTPGVHTPAPTPLERRAARALERRDLRAAYGRGVKRTKKGENRPRNHEHRAGHQVLFWIPNRILDFFDPFRARIKVGPGIGVGIRATELADFFAGIYLTGYVGLPGPRNRRLPKLPFGLEVAAGVELSVLDVAPDIWLVDPDYGFHEFGVGLHLVLLGAEVGFDPYEFVDFFTGIFFVDIADDDL